MENARRTQLFQRSTRRDEAIPGFWSTFQRYNQHVLLLQTLADQNPSLAKVFSLGNSYEGRDIKAIRIGANSDTNKPVFFIEAGIHAREWASPATVSYFAQELINQYKANNATVTTLMNTYDFYIVPVLNVDGYEYTHTNVSSLILIYILNIH